MFKVAILIGHTKNTFKNTGSKGITKNGKKYAEYDSNKHLADKIIKHLKNYNDIKVYTIQDESLTTRTNKIKQINPDIVISIHHNYNSNSNVNGICSFTWHSNSPSSHKLQDIFIGLAKKEGFETHGNGKHYSKFNSWTNLHITRETRFLKAATMLVENGFMNGSRDFERVFGNKQEEYHTKLSKVYVKAICKYLGITYKDNFTSRNYFKVGDKGNGVKKLQNNLIEVGFPVGKFGADGSFGPATREAVLAFQNHYKLSVDGYAGPKTQGKIKELLKKKNEKDIYRVKVNGKQVGAYREKDNILEQVEKNIDKAKDIEIEKK